MLRSRETLGVLDQQPRDKLQPGRKVRQGGNMAECIYLPTSLHLFFQFFYTYTLRHLLLSCCLTR